MAQRRMLHKSIAYSKQLNQISEFAQLLFTWTIPHLDDFGKIEGDAEIIKAIVKPLSSRKVEDFEAAITECVEIGLIQRYSIDEKQIIKYATFDTYQTGLNKRTQSKYPDPPISEKFSEPQRISPLTESNGNELKLKKANLTETKIPLDPDLINPFKYQPKNETENAAKEVWLALEFGNTKAFATTYMYAARLGLPPELFYQFKSEILDDKTISSRGAVFNHKVKNWFTNGRKVK